MTGENPEQKATRLVLPILKEGGYDLVRVMFSGQSRLTLQIMIERKDQEGMTVDDCAWVSRALSDVLEEDDIYDGPYDLEVTSPGVERPLVRPEDYVRFAGEAVLLKVPQDALGRKKIRGILQGMNSDVVSIITDGGLEEISLDQIKSAHLTIMNADNKKGKR